MLVNPTYGAGGSPTPPTPASGYVEDNLVYYYSDEQSGIIDTTLSGMTLLDDTSSSSGFRKYFGFNNVNGMTIESCFEAYGNSTYTYPRIIEISGNNMLEFALANGSGSATNADYHFNPMLRWVGLSDYEIAVDNVSFNTNYTFSIVIDNTTAKCYLNGVLIDSRNTSSGYLKLYNVNWVRIGGDGSQTPNGKIYGARVYNRALTASEIAANHSNDVTKYGA